MQISKREWVMDAFTRRVLEEKYELILRKQSELNEFENIEEFLAEFEGNKAIPSNECQNFRYLVDLIDWDLCFQPGNVTLVNLEGESDLELSRCSEFAV